MIERLNEETRSHHVECEADFDVLFDVETTPRHYLRYLVRQYGFEAPLESTLAMTPNVELMIDLKERMKAGYIAQDLMALGLRAARSRSCRSVSRSRSSAAPPKRSDGCT
jgi:heme oxygenase